MPEIKLKPCPWCGGEAEMYKDNYNKYTVLCSCGVMIGIELENACELVDGWRALFNTINEAAEAWNKRISTDNIAIKPDIYGDGYDDSGNMIYDMYDCPECGKSYELDYEKYDYCPSCGQKFDWEGTENETD